jgi:hypothetical protein
MTATHPLVRLLLYKLPLLKVSQFIHVLTSCIATQTHTECHIKIQLQKLLWVKGTTLRNMNPLNSVLPPLFS